MLRILTINPGSTSKKYAYFEDGVMKAFVKLEKNDSVYEVSITVADKSGKIPASREDFEHPHKNLFELLIGSGFIRDIHEIDGIGIRVVAPGSYFLENRKLDDEYLARLNEAQESAPLHVTPVIEEISKLKEECPDIPVYGISDSSFHASLPEYNRYYAINKKDSDTLDIKKFGYHGLSVGSVVNKVKSLFPELPGKIVVCHLGGGCSITAVRDGVSIDTSMGYSPLEGLVMATRSGDIDPGALVRLGEMKHLDYRSLETYLNHECGLYGVSQKDADLKDVIDIALTGDKDAELAIDIFAMKLKKYLGAYFAEMNGIDLIVLTGTIGVRSAPIRGKIFSGLESLGIALDSDTNNTAFEKDMFIESANSRVKIATLMTEEEDELMRSTSRLVA